MMRSHIIARPLASQVIGTSDDAFVIAEWRDPGGPPGPPRLIAPRHVHHHDDEAWYVLDGTLHVLVGDDEVEAHAGSCVYATRGTPHTFWNPGPGQTRYLLIMTANIYRLVQEIHTMPERTRSALQAVFQKYDSELLEAVDVQADLKPSA
jgi:mannose-6-phosphate isomerase-like protein (cupin superfamily)